MLWRFIKLDSTTSRFYALSHFKLKHKTWTETRETNWRPTWNHHSSSISRFSSNSQLQPHPNSHHHHHHHRFRHEFIRNFVSDSLLARKRVSKHSMLFIVAFVILLRRIVILDVVVDVVVVAAAAAVVSANNNNGSNRPSHALFFNYTNSASKSLRHLQ